MDDVQPRRGIPHDDSDTDPLAPRRGVPLPADVIEGRDQRRKVQWIVLGIALFLGLVIAVVYLLFGGSDRQGRASSTPSQATTTASPDASAPLQPAPSPIEGTPEVVGDTSVTLPTDWEMYADETTEGDRRLIRARDPEGAATLQITTLTSVGKDLVAVCNALVGDQREGYEVDSEQVPMPVSVRGEAAAIVCGFGGAKEGEDSSVQFTLVQRASDAHTLVMRSMQDRALQADAPAVEQAASLKCEAARNFGTPLPLC